MKGICIYCGDEFEVNQRGKKRTYCTKDECIKKAKLESQHKYVARLKSEKQSEETESTSVPYLRVPEIKEKNIEIQKNTFPELKQTPFRANDISDILDLSKRFGTVRYELIQLLHKYKLELDNFEKENITFFHTIEFYEDIENMSGEEAKEILIKLHNDLLKRREIKDGKSLIESMLGSIKMKNPNAFIVQAIQGRGDVLKNIEELKNNKELYDTYNPNYNQEGKQNWQNVDYQPKQVIK